MNSCDTCKYVDLACEAYPCIECDEADRYESKEKAMAEIEYYKEKIKELTTDNNRMRDSIVAMQKVLADMKTSEEDKMLYYLDHVAVSAMNAMIIRGDRVSYDDLSENAYMLADYMWMEHMENVRSVKEDRKYE